jgi:hypothetical protein
MAAPLEKNSKAKYRIRTSSTLRPRPQILSLQFLQQGDRSNYPPNFNLPIPPPGRDGDLIAFGNTVVVMIDSYHGEEYRIIDMTTPITEHTKEEMPLYYYYSKHGIKIIHWWAAVMGCESRKSNVE